MTSPLTCHEPDGTVRTGGPLPVAILPGSFNPLHNGHTDLAAAAAARLGVAVAFELSITNADKPELTPDEVIRRTRQFAGVGAVWVTRAATFVAKAELFPGVTFVVGFDTAARLVDPKYYGSDISRRDACLRGLRGSGCRVIVGGRVDREGNFRMWGGDVFGGLFVSLSEDDFRADVSSTQLRGQA